MFFRGTLLPAMLCLVTVHTAAAEPTDGDSWRQWRGPYNTGVPRATLPQTSRRPKNVKWRTPIPGKGHSTPVVWGDVIYLTTAVAKGSPRPAGADRGPRGGGVPGPRAGGRGAKGRGRGGGRPGGGSGGGGELVETDFLVMALNKNTGAVLWQKTAGHGNPARGLPPAIRQLRLEFAGHRRRNPDRQFRLPRSLRLRPGRQPEMEQRPWPAADAPAVRRRRCARAARGLSDRPERPRRPVLHRRARQERRRGDLARRARRAQQLAAAGRRGLRRPQAGRHQLDAHPQLRSGHGRTRLGSRRTGRQRHSRRGQRGQRDGHRHDRLARPQPAGCQAWRQRRFDRQPRVRLLEQSARQLVFGLARSARRHPLLRDRPRHGQRVRRQNRRKVL